MPLSNNRSLFAQTDSRYQTRDRIIYPRTMVSQGTNTSHGETGTQTGDSLHNSR